MDAPAVDAWISDDVRKEFYYAAHGDKLPDFNFNTDAVKVRENAYFDFPYFDFSTEAEKVRESPYR